jgi:hypothetical protein
MMAAVLAGWGMVAVGKVCDQAIVERVRGTRSQATLDSLRDGFIKSLTCPACGRPFQRSESNETGIRVDRVAVGALERLAASPTMHEVIDVLTPAAPGDAGVTIDFRSVGCSCRSSVALTAFTTSRRVAARGPAVPGFILTNVVITVEQWNMFVDGVRALRSDATSWPPSPDGLHPNWSRLTDATPAA